MKTAPGDGGNPVSVRSFSCCRTAVYLILFAGSASGVVCFNVMAYAPFHSRQQSLCRLAKCIPELQQTSRFPPQTARLRCSITRAMASDESKSKNPALSGCTICFAGRLRQPQAKLQNEVLRLGGSTGSSVTPKTTLVIASAAAYETLTDKVFAAQHMGVPIVSEGWLTACAQAGKLVDPTGHLLNNTKTKGNELQTKPPSTSSSEDPAVAVAGAEESSSALAVRAPAGRIAKYETASEWLNPRNRQDKMTSTASTINTTTGTPCSGENATIPAFAGTQTHREQVDDEKKEKKSVKKGRPKGVGTGKRGAQPTQNTLVQAAQSTQPSVSGNQTIKPSQSNDNSTANTPLKAKSDAALTGIAPAPPVNAKPAAPKAKTMKIERVVVQPVDDTCPGHDGLQLFVDSQHAKQPWSAMLNQANVGQNNNKYYLIQLVKSRSGESYGVWLRWGRVGAIAGRRGPDMGQSLESAKRLFCRKFAEKSGNDWRSVLSGGADAFSSRDGKYTLVEMDYSGKQTPRRGGDDDDVEEEEDDDEVEASALAAEVQGLMQLICDVRMIRTSLARQGCDVAKMPLGQISQRMVQQGFRALKDIESELAKTSPSRAVLTALSNRFFTVVPHNFGFRSIRDCIIADTKTLRAKLLLVEDLEQLFQAQGVLDKTAARDRARESAKESKDRMVLPNPIDQQYQRLGCEIQPLPRAAWAGAGGQHHFVLRYVEDTHAATHHTRVEVKNVFEVHQEQQQTRYEAWEQKARREEGWVDNRALLWHGSRLTNWAGILSQGLRIAPPEAPVTGYMFGKGVYFADSFSKSANYCDAYGRVGRGATGLLVLCEVALGKTKNLTGGNSNAARVCADAGCHSTYGMGRSRPDPAADLVVSLGRMDGVRVPQGRLTDNADLKTSGSLLYNEFIVYDVAQIRMRYLVEVKFK